ncbi:MAG: tRNA 2-thiocytidine biosynthesis TtcA family protein, partial [Defluviitaleaceae bacterium]|nr:tRNA 2-thiocytidine biosynthesis TtcA family protein [Defluviitaleaceae bacterium]
DYDMIGRGETIAVALSGGKDSLATLAALSEMRRFYPKRYELCAITVDLGFSGFDAGGLAKYCEKIGVPYSVVLTNIGNVVFEERKEKNPCSLCAKMRKGALNAEAARLGCASVAYGHNRDDIVQTFFMSLLYEGRLNAPGPVSFLDRTGLRSIRPLIYAPEKDVAGFAKKYSLPVVKSPCPADGNTKREETKRFIAELRGRYKNFDSIVWNAVRQLFNNPGAGEA